jgi:hypothetical protein
MFQDTFTVKKSSYHVKLMYYIWKLDYKDFSHMCPYWWLSVFNHIIIIPLFVFKFTLSVLVKAFKFLVDVFGVISEKLNLYFDKLEEERFEKEKQYYLEHPEKLLDVSKKKREKFTNYDWDLRTKFYDAKNKAESEAEAREKAAKKEVIKQKFLTQYFEPSKEYMLLNDDYIGYVKNREKEASELAKKLEQERIIRNKQRINKILKVVKPILTTLAYFIGSLLVLVCVYYLFKGAVYSYNAIANFKIHPKTIEALKEVFTRLYQLIGCGLVVFGLYKLLSVIFKNVDIKLGWSVTLFKFIFRIIGWPFKFVYKKVLLPAFLFVKNGIYFIIQMVKSNCPAIDWVD